MTEALTPIMVGASATTQGGAQAPNKFSLQPGRSAQEARYTGTEEGDDLLRSLQDERPWFRARALHYLGKMGEWGAETHGNHDRALQMLNDKSPQVRAAALQALGQMGSYGVGYSDFIAEQVPQGAAEREVRRAAIRALGSLGEYAGYYAPTLEDCLDDADPEIVANACIALGAVRGPSERLVEKLRAGNVEVAIGACKGLGALAVGAEGLVELLDHQEARVRAAAVTALAKDAAASEKHLGRVVPLVNDTDPQVRMGAASLLCAMGAKAAPHIAALGDLLEARDPGARAAAATALGSIGEKAASEIPRLEKLLEERVEDTSTLVQTKAGMQAKTVPSYRKPACAAAAALAVMGEAAHRSASKIADGLDCFDDEIRIQCACALTGLGASGAEHEDRVYSLLDDSQPMVVASACYALGCMAETSKRPCPSVAEKIAGCIKDQHPAVRGAAVQGLGKMGEEGTARIGAIAKCFHDRVSYVRAQAVGAVVSCGAVGQMLAPEVCRLMFDPEVRVRLAAAKTLPQLGQRGAAFADEVACLMDDQWPEVRIAGLRALASFGPAALEAGGHLATILQVADVDQSPEVREVASAVADMLRGLEDEAQREEEPAGPEALIAPAQHAPLKPLEDRTAEEEAEDEEGGSCVESELVERVARLLGLPLQEVAGKTEEELRRYVQEMLPALEGGGE